MGGYGSGRNGWRRKAEAQHRVDIRWMKRKGWLGDSYYGSLSWSCRGEQTGSIHYKGSRDRLTLIYRFREYGGEWESVEAPITLEYLPCNYGGERVWMLCPNCMRRCAIVYLAGKYPACRKCYRLAYYSEGETRLDRAMRQARKSQAKLGYDGGNLSEYIFKPKGMHWKTYERHMQKIAYAGKMFSDEFLNRYGHMW